MTAELFFNRIVFEYLDADLIHTMAMHMQGSAGPSGVDAFAWRWLCSSFGSASCDLCSALAAVGHRLCTSLVDPRVYLLSFPTDLFHLISAPELDRLGLVRCQLKAYHCKTILRIIGHVVKEAAGPLQVCTGKDGGCEAVLQCEHFLRMTVLKDVSLLMLQTPLIL